METDLIDEQIKALNKKVIRLSLFGSLLVGIIGYPFVPCSDLLTIFFWFFICAIFSFCLFYKFLFYRFGKHLIEEAKKRCSYLLKKGHHFPDDDHRYNPIFDHFPENIHYTPPIDLRKDY